MSLIRILRILCTLIAFSTAFASNLPKASVQTKKLTKQILSDTLVYPAIVRPKSESQINADTEGTLTKLLVKLGQSVKKGQTLLLIERVDPIYRYTPYKVIAPVSGQVSRLDLSTGTQVARGQRLLEIVDLNEIKLTAEVPGRDLPFLTTEVQGRIVSAGATDDPNAAKLRISQSMPVLDALTGTAQIEMLLLEKPKALSPGQIVKVEFKVNAHEGILIPDHAISYKGNEPFVRVLQDSPTGPNVKLAKQISVKLGKKSRGFVEVLSGLNDSDLLVERASRYLAESEAVEIPPETSVKPESETPKVTN